MQAGVPIKKEFIMYLPALYKLTATGKIQEWKIRTEGNLIVTVQGQHGGKKQQYREVIKVGKNLGKENATTPIEQAEAEAQSKWDKKHNKDYHSTIDECCAKGKVANRGGYLPMLAQSFDNHAGKHLRYSCYVQPKFDGLRAISTCDRFGVKLWFRSGKAITTMGHIVKALQRIMVPGDIWDGELYVHGEDFNNFTGAIRADHNTNPEITEKIEYHIYDYPRIRGLGEDEPYKYRHEKFTELFYDQYEDISIVIKDVDTPIARNFSDAMEFYEQCVDDGYEGIIFRNIDMPYEQKRSYNLLKYKQFLDDEFKIVGAIEGKGKLAGHVGAFVCRIEPGRELQSIGGKIVKFGNTEGTVKAKMKGKTSHLKYLWEHPEEYMGKWLTIKYQNLSKDLIPRFPVAVTIRFDK